MSRSSVREDLTRRVAAIAAEASAEAGGVPVGLLGEYLPTLVAVAATGRRLNRAELDACRGSGAEAGRLNTAPAQLVDLYLSATRLLWEQLPRLVQAQTGMRVPAGELLAMGTVVLRAADQALAAAAAGYADARRRAVRQEEAYRREFIDDLLGGQADVGGLVERAVGYGLHLSARHLVAVIAADPPFSDTGVVTGGAEQALRARFADREVLVASKDGRLVCVVPEAPGGGGGDTRLLLSEVAAQVAGSVRGWCQAAVGRAQPGARGVFRSYLEARETLELAGRLGLTDPVVHPEQVLVYRVLVRDQAAMIDLVAAVLAPLAQARGGAAPLLATLETYFTAGNAVETARRMHVSVRAVSYRLNRVRELTGYTPADPAQRLPLQVAVAGARLLGWPDQPLPGRP